MELLHKFGEAAKVANGDTTMRVLVVRDPVKFLFDGMEKAVMGLPCEGDIACMRLFSRALFQWGSALRDGAYARHQGPLCACCDYEFQTVGPREVGAFCGIFAGESGFDVGIASVVCKPCAAGKSDAEIAGIIDTGLHNGNPPHTIREIDGKRHS